MRHRFAGAAAVGLLAAVMVQAGALPAAAESATARMLTFGEAPVSAGQPVILRGSAVAPKPLAEAAATGPDYQIAGGRRLWFFDPETQDIRSCINQRTSTVGVRIVRCYPGSLSGFRRTFGPAFQP
jgi:hypothetical protein